MINLKNIAKVLLIALFVCVWSENGFGVRVAFSAEGVVDCDPACPKGYSCVCNIDQSCSCKKNSSSSGSDSQAEDAVETTITPGDQTKANFCTADYGIFSSLLETGTTIFKRLRDLIYVVAGFGIIAVAVGGFFGNLNWKWLGAIVISLVVIATAGELIVLITGCEVYGSSLITNTLENPTPMTTAEYNENYTESGSYNTWIEWEDSMDVRKEPAAVETEAAAAAEVAAAGE